MQHEINDGEMRNLEIAFTSTSSQDQEFEIISCTFTLFHVSLGILPSWSIEAFLLLCDKSI